MDKKSTQILDQLKIIIIIKKSHKNNGNKQKYFFLQEQVIIQLMKAPITCTTDY